MHKFYTKNLSRQPVKIRKKLQIFAIIMCQPLKECSTLFVEQIHKILFQKITLLGDFLKYNFTNICYYENECSQTEKITYKLFF